MNVLVPTDSVRSKQRIRVLSRPTKVVVGPLQEVKLKMFVVMASNLNEWKCLTLLVLNCCDNGGSKYISAMVHDFSAR